MKRTGDVYTSDNKPGSIDIAGEETIVSEEATSPLDGEAADEEKTGIDEFSETQQFPEKQDGISESSYNEQVVDMEPETPDIDLVTAEKKKSGDNNKNNLKVEKINQVIIEKKVSMPRRKKVSRHKISAPRHGEFVIKIKKKKIKKNRRGLNRLNIQNITKRDFTSNTDSERYYSQNKDVDINTPDHSDTYDHQLETGKTQDIQKVDDTKMEDSDNEKIKAYSEDTQNKRDLGADIIVLIIIGVIAGVAGFSFIFTQLGLLNR